MGLVTQIQLGTKGYLDITDDVAVPLNFSVSEIQDFSKRQGGYSKTIQLPGTANNNRLFSSIYDVNITDTTFNQNYREKCIILQNGVPVFNGFLQLLSVNKVSPSQENPDEQVTYEVAVRDDSGDFYLSLGDKYLEDLSGWTQYNHIYTLSSITATQGNTWEDAYKYFMMWNQKSEYNLSDFTPSIYAKTYFDKIFLDAGYTYSWPTMSATSFEKLVIPYNGDKPTANLESLSFRAGFSSTTEHQSTPTFFGYYNSDFYDTVIFDNDETPPNFNGNNSYNKNTGIWTSSYYGSVTLKAAYRYEIKIYAPVAFYLQQYYTDDYFNQIYAGDYSYIRLKLSNTIGTSSNNITNNIYDVKIAEIQSFNTNSPAIPNRIYFNSGYTTYYVYASPEFTYTTNVVPGTQVFNKVQGEFIVGGGDLFRTDNDFILDDPTLIPRLSVSIGTLPSDFGNNYFQATPKAELGEGMTIVLSDFIPKKVKQKDFLSGIVKMFNLYITPDKDRDKNLIIETRDEFYDNGGTLDWTDKFVSDDTAKIQFLPDLQNKKIRLSYKEDKDIHNTTYKNATSEVYGQIDYTFDNEFVRDVKLVETIFSPTPIDLNGFGIAVPAINSSIPKNNIRILYDGDWIDNNQLTGNTWTYRSTTAITTTSAFTSYPYAGHFDNPITPSCDFNYGLTDYLYYDTWDNVTENNLYNRYWKRFINQIESGKLMTAKFRLNEYDILNLNFRDKIFIHDTYWFLNKIVDYNSNSKEGLTTVELISVDEGITFSPFPLYKYQNPIKNTGIKYNWIKNEATMQNRFQNNDFGGSSQYIEILGEKNIIQNGSQESIIVGKNNDVAGTKNFIVGDNNTVQGSNVMLFGISGTTIRDSNTIIFGAPIVQYVNFIQAGRDEVLNPFSTTKIINYVDAGRDKVRPLGSQTLEMQINAGRDYIL